MRRPSLAAVFLVGAVSACGNVGPPTFSTAFPEEREGLHIDRLPVDVIDHANIVKGVIAVDPGDQAVGVGISVVGDDLRVAWLGGACEARVRIVVRLGLDGFFIKIDADQSLGGMLGCAALGVPRAVRINLAEAFDDQLFTLVQE